MGAADDAGQGAVERYASGACSLVELARGLGVSRQVARAELNLRGVIVRRPGRPSGSSALARVLTEDYLRREYVERRRSVAELADDLACTRKTVRRYLVEHGIESAGAAPAPGIHRKGATRPGSPPALTDRDLGEGPDPASAPDVGDVLDRRTALPGTGMSREALWAEYVVGGSSTTVIAAAVGCAASTVARDLRRNGIALRRRGGDIPAAARHRARRAGIRRAVMSADS